MWPAKSGEFGLRVWCDRPRLSAVVSLLLRSKSWSQALCSERAGELWKDHIQAHFKAFGGTSTAFLHGKSKMVADFRRIYIGVVERFQFAVRLPAHDPVAKLLSTVTYGEPWPDELTAMILSKLRCASLCCVARAIWRC